MIVFWVQQTKVARPKLKIRKNTVILKAFSTLEGHNGYRELLGWGKQIGLSEMDMHAGRSERIHFDVWGPKLVEALKLLLNETRRGYSWQASRERANVH